MSAKILTGPQDSLEKINSKEPIRTFAITLSAGLIICFIGVGWSMDSKIARNEGRLESLSSEVKSVKEDLQAEIAAVKEDLRADIKEVKEDIKALDQKIDKLLNK
ncbi:MAG: hypothetical protein OXJ52_09660 [Oligoflexia bacterium]|nr:hypothetical protein [Oligoflexia bacterium]